MARKQLSKSHNYFLFRLLLFAVRTGGVSNSADGIKPSASGTLLHGASALPGIFYAVPSFLRQMHKPM